MPKISLVAPVYGVEKYIEKSMFPMFYVTVMSTR